MTAPRYAIYGLNGQWEVEGHGVAPDVEVEELPKDVAAGHDAQLERAVAIVMEQLEGASGAGAADTALSQLPSAR